MVAGVTMVIFWGPLLAAGMRYAHPCLARASVLLGGMGVITSVRMEIVTRGRVSSYIPPRTGTSAALATLHLQSGEHLQHFSWLTAGFRQAAMLTQGAWRGL